MFFYLTLVALDCLLAVVWWTIVKTTQGIYYLVVKYKDGSEKKIVIPKHLSDEEVHSLMDKCVKQELQITQLTEGTLRLTEGTQRLTEELKNLKNNIKDNYI